MGEPAIRLREHCGLGDLAQRYAAIRGHTEALIAALSAEDQCVQSMPDASPAKWHRAHTTWFFEQFILTRFVAGYSVFDPGFAFLFNSYYDAVGARHPRPMRGLLTRPAASRVAEYRARVDVAMTRVLHDPAPEVAELTELGLQHEQQHQELLLTDMLHAFAQNPLAPAVLPAWEEPAATTAPLAFIPFPGGTVDIGHPGKGFCFDNETPRHGAWLDDYALASRLVRNREWLEFMRDGGYRTPTLWMSDGWAMVQTQAGRLRYIGKNATVSWWQMGLGRTCTAGPGQAGSSRQLVRGGCVRTVGWRTPADRVGMGSGQRHSAIHETTGHVWQWTASAYGPYPGYRPAAGAIGEYNGKFMVNQMVLRGGSLATPPNHARPTYRNFFHPDKRWQFSGLRLARDL